MSALLSDLSRLAPVLTKADEGLIRFVIYIGDDDHGEPLFDDFKVDRNAAAAILRKYRGGYIERRKPEEENYSFGRYYIEPDGPKL